MKVNHLAAHPSFGPPSIPRSQQSSDGPARQTRVAHPDACSSGVICTRAVWQPDECARMPGRETDPVSAALEWNSELSGGRSPVLSQSVPTSGRCVGGARHHSGRCFPSVDSGSRSGNDQITASAGRGNALKAYVGDSRMLVHSSIKDFLSPRARLKVPSVVTSQRV